MLKQLRTKLNCQEYAELTEDATKYWQEKKDIQVLPLLTLGHSYLAHGDKVREILEEIKPHRHALDLDAQVDLAAVLIAIGRVPQGTLLLKASLKKEPNHALALSRLAWCELRKSNLDDARDLFAQAFEHAPHLYSVWFNLIRIHFDQENYSAAQEVLDKAIQTLKATHTEQPEAWVKHQTTSMRKLQLDIWGATEDFARADDWLADKCESIEEDDWVALVMHWSTVLAGCDHHGQAEEGLQNAIQHYSENRLLHTRLAQLAQMQGRAMQAAILINRAIKLSEKQQVPTQDQIELWAELSSAQLTINEQQARVSADKAMELAAQLEESDDLPGGRVKFEQARATCAVARVESDAQEYESAEKRFREILEDHPNHMPALQGLGSQQMQRGNIDEAVELFERIREIDPTRGYSALINARHFPEDEETLEKIETAAHQPSLQGSVHSGILFQLASAWEKRGNFGKAFSLAEEANEASRKHLRYTAKEHRQRCARIRHAFPNALYEQRSERGLDSELPVFVVGMPRSGTTLVEQILAGHSQICGAGELGIIPQTIAGLERWERHVGSGRHYPDCVDDLSAYVSSGIAENVLKQLQAFDPDAKHVVDKLPHNFENIGLIKYLFPQAKIISVRRDPRDIAVSNYFTDYQAKFGGMGFAYDLNDIGEQLADHNLLMHHWNEVFPGEILEVHYEDIVNDTEAMSRKMLDYIGVDWETHVINFTELDRPVKTASVWQVRQPIYKTSQGKWASYKDHLKPLFEGTNAKIKWDPIEMVTLPQPGWFAEGVEAYNKDSLDDAERSFKHLLHHIPEHAAANFMLGLIYVRKGHLQDGIELMEKGYKTCPWNENWRKDLMQAYELNGEPEKATDLQRGNSKSAMEGGIADNVDSAETNDQLLASVG